MIRVMLVDDESILTESLEIILSMTGDFEIVGKAGDGYAALSILQKETADIALVDLNMDGMDGIQLIINIKKLYPETKILVLTTFYDEKNILAAIKNGADGYILKDSGRQSIIEAIKNTVSGHGVIDAKVLKQLSRLISPSEQPEKVMDGRFLELTKRELEICSMIGEGYTNSQISALLYISEGTVKNYISSIYSKTGIHDRAQLALAINNTGPKT